VYSRSIKTKLLLTLGTLLLVGMFLIDFVVVITAQQDYIASEKERGESLTRFLADQARVKNALLPLDGQSNEHPLLAEMIAHFGYSGVFVFDRNGRVVAAQGDMADGDALIRQLAHKAMGSGRFVSRFVGSTWSVFWKQNQSLHVAAPVLDGETVVGSVAMIHPLEAYYGKLRQSQKVVMFYMAINVVILSLFGLFRIYQFTLKPVTKLVRRAEDYTDETAVTFTQDKEGSEFGQLSKALNSMLQRISKDKEALKASLVSLERANAEISQAQKEIIRAEKLASVGRLAAGIAHEIGNPIGIVLGYLELLRQGGTAGERSEYLTRAENEITRIKTTIRQLLDFSRPSAGLADVVSVHDVIHEVVEILKVQPLMDTIGMTVDTTSKADAVYMDSSQLRQVFVNLMMNAADAIQSGAGDTGEIRIVTDVVTDDRAPDNEPGRIRIRVDDNGPGVPQEIIGDIFDPFFTTKDPGKGTGLGLSVSFRILEQVNGTIHAESIAGHGTTMTVTLPLISESETAGEE
jgi:two-component system NtrC family sensor kinase